MLSKCVSFSEAEEMTKKELQGMGLGRGSPWKLESPTTAPLCKGPAGVGRDASYPITAY